MPADEGRARAGVKSADRALSILELLVHADRPLGFGEILSTLGYPRSSLFSLLNTLLDRGWIAVDEPSRAYRLGIRTFEAGSAWERSIDLLPLALPHMERIRDRWTKRCRSRFWKVATTSIWERWKGGNDWGSHPK